MASRLCKTIGCFSLTGYIVLSRTIKVTHREKAFRSGPQSPLSKVPGVFFSNRDLPTISGKQPKAAAIANQNNPLGVGPYSGDCH